MVSGEDRWWREVALPGQREACEAQVQAQQAAQLRDTKPRLPKARRQAELRAPRLRLLPGPHRREAGRYRALATLGSCPTGTSCTASQVDARPASRPLSPSGNVTVCLSLACCAPKTHTPKPWARDPAGAAVWRQGPATARPSPVGCGSSDDGVLVEGPPDLRCAGGACRQSRGQRRFPKPRGRGRRPPLDTGGASGAARPHLEPRLPPAEPGGGLGSRHTGPQSSAFLDFNEFCAATRPLGTASGSMGTGHQSPPRPQCRRAVATGVAARAPAPRGHPKPSPGLWAGRARKPRVGPRCGDCAGSGHAPQGFTCCHLMSPRPAEPCAPEALFSSHRAAAGRGRRVHRHWTVPLGAGALAGTCLSPGFT